MLSQVSVRMLRYYDEAGLFKPVTINESTGYRYYSAKQIPDIKKIILYRDLGFNISELMNLLEIKNNADLTKELTRKRLEIQNTIDDEKQKLSHIDEMIKSINLETLKMKYHVELKEIPSFKVVSIRGIVPGYQNEVELWAKLGEYAIKNNINPAGAPFAIYHDGEHKEKDVDIEVAMPVIKLKKNHDEITYRETRPISLAATILYTGPYETITDTFLYLADWIEENNYQLYGKTRQVSIKGAWNEPNPSKYQVEIQMPVKQQI